MPGYGTVESKFEQSLAVLDTQTGQVSDFPDDRTLVDAKQTLYSGLAFSRDGKHLYASMGSISDPTGGWRPRRVGQRQWWCMDSRRGRLRRSG